MPLELEYEAKESVLSLIVWSRRVGIEAERVMPFVEVMMDRCCVRCKMSVFYTDLRYQIEANRNVQ